MSVDFARLACADFSTLEEVDEISGDPGIVVAIGAWPKPGGRWGVDIQVRRDCPRDDEFIEWVYGRIGRLIEHGPQPDGWGLRPDLGYQLVGRLDLPPLDA